MEPTSPTNKPMKPPEAWAEHPAHQHLERFDVPARGFVVFLVAFIAIALILHVALWFLFGLFVRAEPVAQISPLAESRVIPPDPQLQGTAIHTPLASEDMQALLDRENQILGSYGWVNRQQGIARVPIDRAMVLLLQGGLPAATPATQSAAPPSRTPGPTNQ